jgi:hypothetical protein
LRVVAAHSGAIPGGGVCQIGARLCAKHQSQHVEKLCGIRCIPAGWFCEAAAAGLRHSRAPGAVRECALTRTVGDKTVAGGHPDYASCLFQTGFFQIYENHPYEK